MPTSKTQASTRKVAKPKQAFFLLSFLTAAALVACSDAPLPEEETEHEITGTAFRTKKELFESEMLFVRINGWDERKMTPAALADETAVSNAELVVYKARAKSTLHCPDAEATTADLAYKTRSFTLRTSGNLTNGTPKSSYKISLEKKDDRLFGLRKLNLKSMWNDVSQMREGIAWSLFAEAGIPAPRHTYAKLCINGKYFGLYSFIEEVDKPFFKDRGFDSLDEGNLYKAYVSAADVGGASLAHRSQGGDDSGAQYKKLENVDERTYRLKVLGDDEGPARTSYDDLATLVRTVHGKGPAGATGAAYERAVEGVFNVKAFLRWAAVNTLLGAWDNYSATPANYYLYNSGLRAAPNELVAKPYFTWIPWDYDNILGIDYFGTAWHQASILAPTGYDGREAFGTAPLLPKLLESPRFLAYYLDFLEWANNTIFTEASIGAKMERLRDRARQAAFLEGEGAKPAHTGRQFSNDQVHFNGFSNIELRQGQQFTLGIRHFVVMRHANVEAQLAKVRADRKVARGSSGATFPVAAEPVP